MNRPLRALVIGHSHILALQAAAGLPRTAERAVEFEFLPLRDIGLRARPSGAADAADLYRSVSVEGVDRDALRDRIAAARPDIAILCVGGHEHAPLGLVAVAALAPARKLAHLEQLVRLRQTEWLGFLRPLLPERVWAFPSPPPVDATTLAPHFPAAVLHPYGDAAPEAPAFRLQLWQHYVDVVRGLCIRHGIEPVDLPSAVRTPEGFLAPDCWGTDPTHANQTYGLRLLEALGARLVGSSTTAEPAPPPPEHPYQGLPDTAFWEQGVARLAPGAADPVSTPGFLLARRDQIATAGSCFAQHIASRLTSSDFRHLCVEPAAPDDGETTFSARYGNIYTARQLAQLFDRAFGYYHPLERAWQRPDGRWCDPFRPRLRAAGFEAEADVLAARRTHLAAVRRLFRQLDVFIFTLGLTECWASRLDGAVFPVAPGVVAGRFDPQQHAFVNFSAGEVAEDLQRFFDKLKLVNRKARMILTVSPVPMVATAAGRHVLVSNTCSKAALRVAADEIARRNEHVDYFPSYEIVTGAGSYFAADRRSVTSDGVDHVMRVFMARMTEPDADGVAGSPTRSAVAEVEAIATLTALDALGDAACDEETLRRR